MNKNYKPFLLGQVVITKGAKALIEETGSDALIMLRRHMFGDWGNVCAADKDANNQATKLGDRILSSYPLLDNQNVWILTEHDRSYTTIMLPSEY